MYTLKIVLQEVFHHTGFMQCTKAGALNFTFWKIKLWFYLKNEFIKKLRNPGEDKML